MKRKTERKTSEILIHLKQQYITATGIHLMDLLNELFKQNQDEFMRVYDILIQKTSMSVARYEQACSKSKIIKLLDKAIASRYSVGD